MRRRAGRPCALPRDLDRRLERVAASPFERIGARRVAHHLNGRRPGQLSAQDLAALSAESGLAAGELGRYLELLERAGLGAPARRPRHAREHGQRHRERLGRLVGVLPSAIALRLPAFPQTRPPLRRIVHRDRWGRVDCSLPPGRLLAGLRLRLDGGLLDPDTYAERLAGKPAAGRTGSGASVEIELPAWIAEAVLEPERSRRRRTYFDFQVFHSLWPLAQRLYLFLQGLGPGDEERRRRFYLAPQQLVTLGLIGTPQARAVRYVRAALTRCDGAP